MSAFHIHIDAALLPPAMEKFAKENFGFYDDDFEHTVRVQGVAYSARHLTRKLANRSERSKVRAICKSLDAQARECGFKGVIQAEFIMHERALNLNGGQDRLPQSKAPFEVRTRPLDSARGERFKRHELHLELETRSTSPELVDRISGTGLFMTRAPSEVTFTASGHPNEILALKRGLEKLLAESGEQVRGKLTTEATVYHSLHGVETRDLPEIVGEIVARA